ncbi:transcriptional antitermination N peptide [Citrobacter telavivensis]
MTKFIASNSVTRRYLKRGDLMAKRRAEASQNALHEVKHDVSRVDRATSLGSLRDSNTGGSACLPDVAIYAAGYRNTKQVTAR